MDILDHMDILLASATEQGQVPQHFLIRQEDWLAIGDRLGRYLITDPSRVGANTYREVPVHFSHLNESEIVGIVVEYADPIFATA